jgi:hypothetical protein
MCLRKFVIALQFNANRHGSLFPVVFLFDSLPSGKLFVPFLYSATLALADWNFTLIKTNKSLWMQIEFTTIALCRFYRVAK